MTTSNKFPLSVSGKPCVGPCYYPGATVQHPQSLEEITSNVSFCPVERYVYTDQTGKSDVHFIDKCNFPTTTNKHYTGDDINLIIPNITFNSEYFVKIYYKINSLEDALKWLDNNKNAPYATRKRIFTNSMVTYGNSFTIVDVRMAEYINEIFLKNLRTLYKKLRPYIKITDDNVDIVQPTKDATFEPTDEEKLLVYAYIKEKFLGVDNVIQFMSKFIRHYKNDLTSKFLPTLLVDRMCEYIIKKINNSI